MNELPLIDISALQDGPDARRVVVADALGQAFHKIGFAVIRGHGISTATINAVREQVIACFKLPLGDKLALSVSPDNYRGYIPLGFFTPNAEQSNARSTADHYEGYKLHYPVDADDPICRACDLYGPNKWPAQLPKLESAVLAYWSECDRVTHLLLRALAQHLGANADALVAAFEKPLTNMTLLHYPPQFHSGENTPYGIHPHKDTDAITLLAPDPVGGLFVRGQGSTQWIEAKAPADALVVNIGDMLEIMSGGYFVSTPHKVVNASGAERYSFPYFAVPRYDVEIKPLGKRQRAGFQRANMRVGDVSRDIWQSNWPDSKPVDAQYDPYSH